MSANAVEVVEFQATLPVLIERASRTLLDAKSSAEVLEARDMARVAYAVAKTSERIAKAQQAHDEVVAAVHQAMKEALLVEARAKMRLADEYGGAQERGEVAKKGGARSKLPEQKFAPTAADVGIDHKDMHEARKLRDAEKASPGKTERVLNEMVERGETPTKAKLHRALTDEVPPLAKPKQETTDPERRKLEKLTPDALIDEVLGLRADLADAKAKLKKQADEIKALKDEVKGFEGDQAAQIRRQQGIIRHKESEMYRANDKADKALAQVHVLKKRIAELEKMGIAV